MDYEDDPFNEDYFTIIDREKFEDPIPNKIKRDKVYKRNPIKFNGLWEVEETQEAVSKDYEGRKYANTYKISN